jgi:hypothetical protein
MSRLPRFQMPDVKFPELAFELPDFDLPGVDLPSSEQVAAFARDAAFVGVGLAVMTAERVRDVQQQALATLTARFDEARDQVRAGVQTIVGRVAETVER